MQVEVRLLYLISRTAIIQAWAVFVVVLMWILSLLILLYAMDLCP